MPASVPQQQVIRDFGRSRAKALNDIAERLPQSRRSGMPGYKKRREARPSLNHTKNGFRLKDGRLHLAGGITVGVVWSRALPAAPSSVRIYQDSLGCWNASFVVPATVEPLPSTGAVLGVDWGVREVATTTSDAYDLPHPAHGAKAEQKLGRYDRMMSRRKPKKGSAASGGYRKAKTAAGEGVQEGRPPASGHWPNGVSPARTKLRAWGRAKKALRDHDALAVEDFKPKFLAKTTMAKKAADAAIGATKQAHTRHAPPGWSPPGWCRGHKTTRDVVPGGSLSQGSPSGGGGFKTLSRNDRGAHDH